MITLVWVLLALLAGSAVFCTLILVAARDYLAQRPHLTSGLTPISILKPLSGVDEGLEDNLRSFFEQQHPCYEILASVRNEADSAAAVFRKMQAEYPHVPSRLLLVGDPPYANAKVWSLERMTQEARYDLLVMSDSDIRVTPEMLRVITAEFQDPHIGVSTCPYRAVSSGGIWSELEAVGMNTEFLSGVLVARMLDGMRFALGPTITARRQAIVDAGGWTDLARFLAEDFVLGHRASKKGWTVLLSSYVIEHRIGSEAFGSNARHRLRWARSTRRSRPAGYVGQVFTNPTPFLLVLSILCPDWWRFLVVLLALRVLAAYVCMSWVLEDKVWVRRIWLLPLQDLLSFAFWVAGFFGNTIEWRGKRYRLHSDGTFTPI